MSTGYLRPLWLPMDDEALTEPSGPLMPALPAAPPVDALPAPPAYESPDLLSAPPLGFRERLAAALAGRPAYRPRVGTTGAQAFFGGLLSGAGRGFSNATIANSRAQEVERERTNTVRKAEADRNWANAQATWRARLAEEFRTKTDQRGKILVTDEMAKQMGAPAAAGSYRDPVEVGNQIRARQNVARVPADLAETMGKPAGAETTSGEIIAARNFLRPKVGKEEPVPGVLTDEQRRALTGLNTAIRSDPDIKDFITVRDNYKRMSSMSKLASGQGDLSLIFAYMKVLDPTSVVREAEYNNAAEAIGKLPQLANVPQGWLSGKKLTPAGRQGFIAAAESLYNAKKQDHDRATAMYRDQANALGVDPKLVLRDFSAIPETAATPPRAGYVRIVHPDGTVADFPAGQAIPAGWRKQ